MSKIDLSPLLEKLDAAVAELVSPPFRIWEPFEVLKTCGEILREADPLASKEEYQEALSAAWNYLDGKYEIIRKVDNAVKVGVLLEPFDGPLFRLVVEKVAIPQLAAVLADNVG